MKQKAYDQMGGFLSVIMTLTPMMLAVTGAAMKATLTLLVVSTLMTLTMKVLEVPSDEEMDSMMLMLMLVLEMK